jgi:predicted enzyme related to lactoylglutathione lyase
MAERSEYVPGTFCWADLTTPDQDAAKTFYGSLLGWDAEDIPVGGGAIYSLMHHAGKQVAAISPQPPQQRDAGAPPMWNSYVSVSDADAAVERAKELGGSAHAPAFDVMDAGRMAVLQDPQGTYFMVWQPRRNPGAQLVSDVGALVWNELATTDIDSASSFYGELFDWTFEPFEASPTPYTVIMNTGRSNGGITEIDAAISRTQELGGTMHAGPIELPMAKLAVVADPQGAMFALYAGQYDP